MDKTLASKLVDAIMETKEDGEWTSMSMNLTAGPKETPMVNINLIPGTTKENAIRIQNGAAETFKGLNK